jgi:hypothetical protein
LTAEKIYTSDNSGAIMPFYMSTVNVNHLGYAAIFLCVSIGFFLIQLVAKDEVGPIMWGFSFLFNCVGFIWWSGIIPLGLLKYLLIGELFHMTGFLLFVCGVYRFTERKFKPWNAIALSLVVLTWISMLLSFPMNKTISIIGLRALRSILFLYSGLHLLVRSPVRKTAGNKIAGVSQIIWALYMLIYGFFQTTQMYDFVFGLLVGFQVLAAFGIIVMIVDRIHLRAAKTEKRVYQLEKLLPICAHCRKIHGKDNEWYDMETYIEKNTASQFSHGICPECMQRYFPQYTKKSD